MRAETLEKKFKRVLVVLVVGVAGEEFKELFASLRAKLTSVAHSKYGKVRSRRILLNAQKC